MMILIFFWWTAKTVAGSYMRVTMREWLVWGQISDPNINQDTIGKLQSRAFYWCNKNEIVLLQKDTQFISKGENVACSDRFWLCPD
jgi:hypothetical protein